MHRSLFLLTCALIASAATTLAQTVVASSAAKPSANSALRSSTAQSRNTLPAVALRSAASLSVPQESVVRTADPAKRGLKESDFPRMIKVADNVYTYEDFHAGDEKFVWTQLSD